MLDKINPFLLFYFNNQKRTKDNSFKEIIINVKSYFDIYGLKSIEVRMFHVCHVFELEIDSHTHSEYK